MENSAVIEAQDLKKYYTRGTETVKALDGVDFSIYPGEIVAIVGPSGSGKTTLMNLISCLDKPTSGTLKIGGSDVTHFTEKQLISVRRRYIGFIFQQFFLIPNLTAAENVLLPVLFARTSPPPDQVSTLLKTVGLEGKKNIPVHMLSGGDKQRVAIARALINKPKLLIADEPTGKLETAVRDQLIKIFRDLASKDIAVFIATHDLELAGAADRTIHLQDGCIIPKEKSSLYH